MKTVKLPTVIINGTDYSDQLRGKKIESGKPIITLPETHGKNENIDITIKKPSTSTYNNFMNNVIYGVKYDGDNRVLDKITSSSGCFDIVEGNLYWKNNLIDNSGLWLSLAATTGQNLVWGIRDEQLYYCDQETGNYQKHSFDTSSFNTSNKYNIDHLKSITGCTGGYIYMTSPVYRTWFSSFCLDTVNNSLSPLNAYYRETFFSKTYEKPLCIHGITESGYSRTCRISPVMDNYISSTTYFTKGSTDYDASLDYLKLPTGLWGHKVPLYIANNFLCYYDGSSCSVSNHTSKPTSAVSTLKGWTHLCNVRNNSYAIRNGILYRVFNVGDSSPTITVINDKKEWIDVDGCEYACALTSQGEVYTLNGTTVSKYKEVELTENKDYHYNSGNDNANKYNDIQLTKEFLNSLIM